MCKTSKPKYAPPPKEPSIQEQLRVATKMFDWELLTKAADRIDELEREILTLRQVAMRR